MWVISVWAISGVGRLTPRLGSSASTAALLRLQASPSSSSSSPTCPQLSQPLKEMVFQTTRAVIKSPPLKCQNFAWHLLNMAVNYILLIYSSQNDNCSPWHNTAMCEPLLQIGLIAFTKQRKKGNFQTKTKQRQQEIFNFSNNLTKVAPI